MTLTCLPFSSTTYCAPIFSPPSIVVGYFRDLPLVQPHPGCGIAEDGTGDDSGLLGAVLQKGVQLFRVVEQLQRLLPDRGEGLHDHLGEVFLEVTVALAPVLFL